MSAVRRLKLTVISDTAITRVPGRDRLSVFEPPLREMEAISELFEETIWYGYLAQAGRVGSSREPASDSIVLRLFPTIRGGKTVVAKLRIVLVLPVLTWMVFNAVRKSDVIHTRGPSVPAAICIALSWLFRKKLFWHKYAGNWVEPTPPFMYSWQRWMLKRANHGYVTINGKWPSQLMHIFPFENPCFTRHELEYANRRATTKRFNGVMTLCFVGYLTEAKGVIQLLDAVRLLRDEHGLVFKLIISGDGPLMERLRTISEDFGIDVRFTGYLKRHELNAIYESSHALVLPSRTEGFPKVVAEGAAFGCIPVVTNVSAIGQYLVHGRNGFLLESNSPGDITRALKDLSSHANLKAISEQAVKISHIFTYENFRVRVAKMLGISLNSATEE